MVEWTDWQGLYWKGWKGTAVEEAFTHPAKFSRALIEHIYRHLVVEEGWLKPGDTVIDPFAGVALGALDAMYYGLHWRGQELEIKFVDTGQGCDCEGFTKEEWRRYHRRHHRVNYSYGHHWCPGCVRAMGGPAKHHLARRVPYEGAHHYTGNIELWNARYARGMGGWGTAALVQGDSRYPVLHQWGSGPAEGAVSSPPYADRIGERSGGGHTETFPSIGTGGGIAPRDYGDTPGQLGQMLPGDLAGSVSSPPYRGGGDHHDQLGGYNTNIKAQGRLGLEQAGYGDTPGQLAKMPSGAVSSPPYAESMERRGGIESEQSGNIGGPHSQMNRSDTRYGTTPGQLGAMKGSVSSPPFGAGETRNRQPYQDGAVGDMMGRAYTQDRQGTTSGNLAQMDASVSSPPYEESLASDDPAKRGGLFRDPKRGGDRTLTAQYGSDPGQLARMPRGSVTSPPYEGSTTEPTKLGGGRPTRATGEPADRNKGDYHYSTDPENLGNERGETFWSAARMVVQGVYDLLAPGGHSVWVVKNFVRKGKIVPFTEQWREMCESVGFVTVHGHWAHLVQERGVQRSFLEDGDVDKRRARKSFFRRLAEQKGSPPIEWEVVWCMVKP